MQNIPTLATMIIHALLHTLLLNAFVRRKLRQLKRRKTNRDGWHKTVVELLPVRSEMHSWEHPRSAHLQSVLQCTRKCTSGEGPWFRLKPHARQRQFARRYLFCMMCGKGISTPFPCTLRDTKHIDDVHQKNSFSKLGKTRASIHDFL